MLILAASGFLDEPSVTLRDAERQIRQDGRMLVYQSAYPRDSG